MDRCWECDHLEIDHHKSGYCEKSECRCAEFEDIEFEGCEYGCPYGSAEHEARLVEWEMTGQW